jgi:hypothetical protein
LHQVARIQRIALGHPLDGAPSKHCRELIALLAHLVGPSDTSAQLLMCARPIRAAAEEVSPEEEEAVAAQH